MRLHPGLLACGLTITVMVPAAIVHLDAGPAQRGRLFAAAAQTARIDGAEVRATLDRHVADRGDTVQLQLTGTAAVEVGVVVFGASGAEEARVPQPPNRISFHTVKLAPSAHGRFAAAVPVTLTGAGRDDMPSVLDGYTFYVTSRRAAEHLDALRRKISGRSGDDGDPDVDRLLEVEHRVRTGAATREPEDDRLFAPGSVAVVTAHTRHAPKGLAMVAPERAVAGVPFEVAVYVTNPTQRRLTHLEVDVLFPRIADDYLGVPLDEETLDLAQPESRFELAPGETARMTMRVTGKKPGTLGFGVRVSCADENCTPMYPMHVGTFEAIEIVEASEGEAVATRRAPRSSPP